MAETSERLNLTAGLASVGVALTLIALKAWALVVTGSLSVAASLTDSALDLVASLAGLAGIIYAARPPDEDHSFGHTSAEDLVSLGQAVLVATSGVAIGWAAIGRLGAPQPLAAEGFGLAIMLVSIVLTGLLVWWQGRVAAQTGSKIVAADRLHYLSDLVPSIGAIVALIASARFGVRWLDPVVAIGTCAMLITGAGRIGIGAWHALMDREAEPALLARITEVVRAYPGVVGFHDLKTRTAGTKIFVQIHLELDGGQSLRDAHAISAGVRRTLLATFPNTEVIIHQDPA